MGGRRPISTYIVIGLVILAMINPKGAAGLLTFTAGTAKAAVCQPTNNAPAPTTTTIPPKPPLKVEPLAKK